MSHLLWKYFWDQDVEKFRRLLSPPALGTPRQTQPRTPVIGHGSPNKSRKASGSAVNSATSKSTNVSLSRAEINSRDHAGLTVLLRLAAMPSAEAIELAHILLQHPAIDVYAQDLESGWNALHRSLYHGNISIARLLLERERKDLSGETLGAHTLRTGLLIKTKDHEGNSPFELYNSTISLQPSQVSCRSDRQDDSSDDEDGVTSDNLTSAHTMKVGHAVYGDEIFTFGSNKNLSLGVGDEDDRQFPERINLQRTSDLLRAFYADQLSLTDIGADHDVSNIPILTRSRQIQLQDVVMSKFHSAILTADPKSNLYVCGVGRGGRLGLGHENTQFRFVPVQGVLAERKVHKVALGQNHSMAIVSPGELWTWGLNTEAQLGYVLPISVSVDEEPMTLSPRQVFGALKKEFVQGIAASSIHSVAHTGTSLFCWGRNLGQLGLMDSDSRSLELQTTPRKVAASLFPAPIQMISAIDKATTCLLANHSVCVFTNYGYNFVKFPLPDAFANSAITFKLSSHWYDPSRNNIRHIASGGETIAAVTRGGDLFTMALNKVEGSKPATSTTNPAKIRGAITNPQHVWSSKKDGIVDVSVGEHGSVILCTQSGAVWRRVKRTKAKDAKSARASNVKVKDFKFQRVPNITKVISVKSSTFGAFAAIRKDSDVLRNNNKVNPQTLWKDIESLLPIRNFESSGSRDNAYTIGDAARKLPAISREFMSSHDVETDLDAFLKSMQYQPQVNTDVRVCTSILPHISIPAHSWVLAGRSPIMRHALAEFKDKDRFELPEVFIIEKADNSILITLMGLDVFTLLNLVLFSYMDTIAPVWGFSRVMPQMAHRFRQVRSELMRLATRLEMPNLEAVARLQTSVVPCLDSDFAIAIQQKQFFSHADVIIELSDGAVFVHSDLICRRCPFFEGMFNGRSQGLWISNRREAGSRELLKVDLKHICRRTFSFVKTYLYADTGLDMFDQDTSKTLDEFSDLVMDVMSVANELMLDRLAQICQHVMGRFVTTRNVAWLLNEISPCAETSFKKAGLKYICLQMEAMLENHLLDDLDEDLLFELDEAVRETQLATAPLARSNYVYTQLHARYPDLVQDIEEERQRRAREIAFKAHLRDDERRSFSSFRTTRTDSFGEHNHCIGSPELLKRNPWVGSPAEINEIGGPVLGPKRSMSDLIFDLEDEVSTNSKPVSPKLSRKTKSFPLRAEHDDNLASKAISPWRNPLFGSVPNQTQFTATEVPKDEDVDRDLDIVNANVSPNDGPWAATSGSYPLKPNLRDILSEGFPMSSSPTGTPASSTSRTPGRQKGTSSKISQKERKRLQQLQAIKDVMKAEDEEEENTSRSAWRPSSKSDGKSAPWKLVGEKPKSSLSELLVATRPSNVEETCVVRPKLPLVTESSAQSFPGRTGSPDTRFAGQKSQSLLNTSLPSHSSKTSVSKSNTPRPTPNPQTQSQTQTTPLKPHSKTYMTPAFKEESFLGLSMEEIIGLEKQKQDLVREAVAKRSLQDIQQEQEFQQWWDQESRKTQEEETKRMARERHRERAGRNSGRRGYTQQQPHKRVRGNAEGKGKDKEADQSTSQGNARQSKARGRDKSNNVNKRGGDQQMQKTQDAITGET